MKLKTFILLLIILILSGCAGRKIQPPARDIPPRPVYDIRDIHRGLEGQFLFYISREESGGDIWLYNLDSNSRWKITSEDDETLRINSFSPSYRYILYNDSILYDISQKEKIRFYSLDTEEIEFPRLKDVNWAAEDRFYFLSATNGGATNIFLGRISQRDCFIEPVPLPLEHPAEENLFSLSLSYDGNLLAFISRDPHQRKSLFVFDIKKGRMKRLISMRDTAGLLWSEKSDMLYFFEDYFLYSISLKGEKNLVVSEGKSFSRLLPFPGSRYKFLYVTTLGGYSFVSLKNLDYTGQGDFLFNAAGLKDVAVFKDAGLLFFDNGQNEIMSYHLEKKEIGKIAGNASLFR